MDETDLTSSDQSIALQDCKIVGIIQRFYTDLVKVLPLNDAVFRSELFSAGLLPGNLKSEILSKPTPPDMAEYFLDYGINNDSTNFHKLISIMESLNNDGVQRLAGRMKATLPSLQTAQVTTPIIDIQPSSQSIDLLQHAIFTCIATGYNVKYQWTIGSGSFPSKVTGINTNTLVIPDVRSFDNNTYTCTISNDGGNVTSNPAKLTITGLPEITVYPSIQSVEVTQPVKFTTTVNGVGKEKFSYQWRHDGEDINGETSNTLTIDSVTKDDGGTYECVVKNEFGDNATSNTSEIKLSDKGKKRRSTSEVGGDSSSLLPPPVKKVKVNELDTPDDASIEFGAVVSDIAEELNKCINKNESLNKIKLVCYQISTVQNIPLLSQVEIQHIKSSESIYDVFTVLHPHWNWCSHHILQTIIKRVKSPRAQELLKKFKDKINYKMKLKDVHEHLKNNKMPIPRGYSKMVAILDKDYSEVTLEEGLEIEEFVTECLGQSQPSEVNESCSIEIMWYVSSAAVDILTSMAMQRKEEFLLESFLFLKIGENTVFDQRDNKQKIIVPQESPAFPVVEKKLHVCQGTVNTLLIENSQIQNEMKKQICLHTRQDSLVTTQKELERSMEIACTSGATLLLMKTKLQRLSSQRSWNAEAELQKVKQELNDAKDEAKQLQEQLKRTQVEECKKVGKSSDIDKPYIHESGTLTGFLQCMIIDSHGGKYENSIKAIPLDPPLQSYTDDVTCHARKDIELFQKHIRKDDFKELVFSLNDSPGSQNLRQYFLDNVEELFKECKKAGVMIYYTGYGEEKTGNWCFKDGTISFRDIFSLYKKYLAGKFLYIITDCCYSGQWVIDCAKHLDDIGMKACGHEARKQGILIKVFASCQPSQKATIEMYLQEEGIFRKNNENILWLYYNKILSDTQTAYGCDFTKTKCFQMEGIEAPCQLPYIPAKCSWKWKDVVAIDRENKPENCIHIVRRDDLNTWYIILVAKDLLEKFHALHDKSNINVNEYGYIIKSGEGENPPDDILQQITEFSPSYRY